MAVSRDRPSQDLKARALTLSCLMARRRAHTSYSDAVVMIFPSPDKQSVITPSKSMLIPQAFVELIQEPEKKAIPG